MSKICLTGSTGALGSKVLQHLLNTVRIDPKSLVISLYNPSKAPKVPDGVEIRQGDYENPANLLTSFADCSKLFLVSYPSLLYERRVAAHKNAIDAAKQAGVKHIYYTSLAFGDDSKAFVKQAHLDTEAYLREVCEAPGSTMSYTSIEEGIYSESFPLYIGFFEQDRWEKATDRVVKVPSLGGPGPAWITQDNLGEANARIIADDFTKPQWRNRLVLLSGPKAISLQGVVDIINESLGWEKNPLRIEAVGAEEYLNYASELKTGKKDDEATKAYFGEWVSSYPAMERGETSVVDPLAKELVGRELTSMREYLDGLFQGKQKTHVDSGKYD
ncbi:MAG: hypothetical protein Q9160_004506 [Pyrenula sp. 1 TL-2023]